MKLILSVILSGVLLLAPVCAGAAEPQALPPPVQKAETYLRALKTAQARFLMTAPDGSTALGTFFLSRPGKLRFEYDPPMKDFVVADGLFIYFYDADLGQQSNAPIGQTLANFLLRSNLRLSGDVKVTDYDETSDILNISLEEADDPSGGRLIMTFAKNPFSLKRWRVVDATGSITQVELFQLQEGVKLASSLFVYSNPDSHRVNE
jgi:outer membrane lipoprotein-sorting protein